jgi:hypothetical protein
VEALSVDFITFVFGIKSNIDMELNGKIIQIMPEQGGNGRNGTWRKRDYIVETQGNYPKKVCVTVWGDKIDQFNLQAGEQVKFGLELESREYNGKWYTEAKGWKVDREGEAAQTGRSQASAVMPDVTTFSDDSADDVLPF